MMDISEKRATLWQCICTDDGAGARELLTLCDREELIKVVNGSLDFSGDLRGAQECIPVPSSVLRGRLDVSTPWCLCAALCAYKVAGVLLQNDVRDVTVRDHAGLNVIHVLASVAYVSPRLCKDMVSYFLWLKEALQYQDLKTLLKGKSDQNCNPLELSIHLGVFRLATEIFNTEGIYVTSRHVGLFQYKAYDITEYELEYTKPYNILLQVSMMDRADIDRPDTHEFLENEPLNSWVNTKRRLLTPFIFIWFLTRLFHVFALMNLTELALLDTSTINSSKCPSYVNLPEYSHFPVKIATSCVLCFMSIGILVYDVFTIVTSFSGGSFVEIMTTPTKLKLPLMFPFVSRLMQTMIAVWSIIYIALTFIDHSTQYQQVLLVLMSLLLFWQILFFAQFLPFFGYCVLTLYHMAVDWLLVVAILSLFGLQQAYVLRVIVDPCPGNFRSFLNIMYEVGYLVLNVSNGNFHSSDEGVMYIWRYGLCIIGTLLIVNFVIALFSNTVSSTAGIRHSLMTLQRMYILQQVGFVTSCFLRSYYWKRHRRFFKYMDGRIYIISEGIRTKSPNDKDNMVLPAGLDNRHMEPLS